MAFCSSTVSDGRRANRRLINDTPHGGKAVLILMLVRRAKCRACGRKGLDELIPHVRSKRHMTDRLFDLIAREGLLRTNSSVGRMVHVSEGTARSVVHEFIDDRIVKLERVTPRVLGLDEKMILRKYRAILGNVEQRTILDMLPDRDWSLEPYLRDLPDKDRVEVFCTDMYAPYAQLRRRHLPRAAHLTDKFHVVRRANIAMDKIRAAVAAGLDGKDRTQLRNAKKIFAMRESRVEDWAHEKLKQWRQRHPILSEAYFAKERYFAMYELCHTPSEGEAYYRHWMKTLPASIRAQFKAACSIHSAWVEPVFNYFDHPFTTGYVEAVNRVIDDVQRAGRGYSFEIIRGKMLLGDRLEKKTFRDRNPGAMMSAGADTSPLETFNWGIDIAKLGSAVSTVSTSYHQHGDRFEAVETTRGLATISLHDELHL